MVVDGSGDGRVLGMGLGVGLGSADGSGEGTNEGTNEPGGKFVTLLRQGLAVQIGPKTSLTTKRQSFTNAADCHLP